MEKICTSCGEIRPVNQFHKKSTGVMGRQEKCKSCRNYEARLYRSANQKRLAAEARERRAKDGEKINADRRKNYTRNKDNILSAGRKWRAANRERSAEYHRQYSKNNRQSINRSMRKWYLKNKDRISEKRRAQYSEKYKSCPAYTCNVACRRIIRRAVIDIRISSSIDISSSSINRDKFRQRIEFNFQPGMTWENYGEWHIDHSIPVSRFIGRGFFNPSIINALCNLRPMWASDNLSKGSSSVLDSEYRDKINGKSP